MNKTNSTEAGPVAVVEQETNDEELRNIWKRVDKAFHCWSEELIVERDDEIHGEGYYKISGVGVMSDYVIEDLKKYGFRLIQIRERHGELETIVYDNLPTILNPDQD